MEQVEEKMRQNNLMFGHLVTESIKMSSLRNMNCNFCFVLLLLPEYKYILLIKVFVCISHFVCIYNFLFIPRIWLSPS